MGKVSSQSGNKGMVGDRAAMREEGKSWFDVKGSEDRPIQTPTEQLGGEEGLISGTNATPSN